jgi:hypothetical protein
MRNSRGYVKRILAKNKKHHTKLYQRLESSTETPRGTIYEIDWNKFSDREMYSLSRMKLTYFPELVVLALTVRVTRNRLKLMQSTGECCRD